MAAMNLADFVSSAHISVHLAPGALLACEVQRQWGLRKLTRKASFQFQPSERAFAMQRLQAWIGDAPARRSLGWVIGPTEAQYFILPWSPNWVDRRTRDAYARARYEQLYEKDARTAAFSFASPSAAGEQLVSCISADLQAELARHAQEAGCALQGIKPSLSAVWERFRDVLESEQGTLCLVDGDRQAIIRHDRRRIEHVKVERCTPGALLRHAGMGVMRRFSNAHAPTADVDLRLPRWQSAEAEPQDSRYAFALCGV